MKKLLLVLLITLVPCYLFADEIVNIDEESQLALPDNPDELADFDFDNLLKDFTLSADTSQGVLERIENEFWYVVVLACLSVISLLIVLHYLKLRPDSAPRDFVSAAGLSMIIFGTIILVLVVDTSEQLTAAIGILGAIAGYLFRTAQEGSKEKNLQQEP